MASPVERPGATPGGGVHPEIARFQTEFDRAQLPVEVQFTCTGTSIKGKMANTGLSRLGFASGVLLALLIGGTLAMWVPVLSAAWSVLVLLLVVALPFFGAHAAIFRYRKGRTRRCQVCFPDDEPTWKSNDDEFWEPVKDFFGL